jgi:superfamily II DNA/RNA helicase
VGLTFIRRTSSKRTGKILTTFRDLGVLPEIADALERVGITTPFPIQEMTLSVALMGTDLIGQARTGTGKTLAFGIPVLQRTVARTTRTTPTSPPRTSRRR